MYDQIKLSTLPSGVTLTDSSGTRKYLQKLNKYINKLSLVGGDDCPDNNPDFVSWNKIPKNGDITSYKKDGSEITTNLTFDIYEKILDPTKVQNLFLMAGWSTKSMCNSSKVIINKLDILKTKYRAIYVINLNSAKDFQTNVCELRDGKNATSDQIIKLGGVKSLEYIAWKNSREIELNDNLATLINKFISELKLTNVDVLGKSSGGGVAIDLVTKSDIYKSLFLAVPSSPLNVSKLPSEVLKRVQFIFGWNEDDKSKFDWHKGTDKNSSTEYIVYNETMEKFKKIYPDIKYHYVLYTEYPNDVSGHEINYNFLDLIVKTT